MNLDAIVEARIHPAIGIARVGNSDDFFIGPELPTAPPPPPGGYRDSFGRLKRQAALFRIYGYDAKGNAVAELTASNSEIAWTVHVANKKAAWYDFDAALDLPEAADLRSARRNAAVQGKDREDLIIDPGARTISGKSEKTESFDTGKFLGDPVYLGEIHTDQEGRLIFVGGKGKSGSPLSGYTLNTFANNPGWHDDTSDGPISATVKIGARPISVDSAWVVTGPPNYSPDLCTPQTMYDVITDALAGSLLPRPLGPPSFSNDILPLLSQFHMAQWVNFGFFVQFGWGSPNDFLRPDVLAKLAAAPQQMSDPFAEVRKQIFYAFRDPSSTTFEPLAWPPMYGDAFGSYDRPPGPRVGFAVTPTLYNGLRQWMLGNFIADYNPKDQAPQSLDDLPLAQRPSTLDKAALHWCMGGPFHPGCEMTWPMRHSSMYRAPYRLRQRPASTVEPDYGEFLNQVTIKSTDGPLSASGPGDITKWMAVPWQADTASCRSGYSGTEFPADDYIPTFWPSRVPNTVLPDENYAIVIDPNQPMQDRLRAFYDRVNWLQSLGLKRPYVEQITKMVDAFGKLGTIERRDGAPDGAFSKVMYVQTLAPDAAAPKSKLRGTAALEAGPGEDAESVTLEFSRARFGGLRSH